MSRTYEQIERWEIPPDRDQWQAIRAADAYLWYRLNPGGGYAFVYDARGHVSAERLAEAYEQWQREPHRLRSVTVSYEELPTEVRAELQAVDLDHGTESLYSPTLVVSVKGPDAAEVRGIAAEAIERGQQGVIQSPGEPAELAAENAGLANDVPGHGAESAGEQAPSRLSRVCRDPWTVTIAGGVIVGVVLLIIQLVFH